MPLLASLESLASGPPIWLFVSVGVIILSALIASSVLIAKAETRRHLLTSVVICIVACCIAWVLIDQIDARRTEAQVHLDRFVATSRLREAGPFIVAIEIDYVPGVEVVGYGATRTIWTTTLTNWMNLGPALLTGGCLFMVGYVLHFPLRPWLRRRGPQATYLPP